MEIDRSLVIDDLYYDVGSDIQVVCAYVDLWEDVCQHNLYD